MKSNLLKMGYTVIAAGILSSCAAPQKEEKVAKMNRNEIAEELKWDLTPLYANEEAWKADFDKLAQMMDKMPEYKGKLGKDAKTLLEAMNLSDEISKLDSKLGIYCSLLCDQDISVTENREREKKLEQLNIEYGQKVAFTTAEMAAISNDTYDKYMKQLPELADKYSMVIDRIKNKKAHTLSDVEEQILAKTALMGNPCDEANSVFQNAEMQYPTLKTSNGENIKLNHAGFSKARALDNRDDRKKAFDLFWDNYKLYEGTLGELLNGNARDYLFSSVVRKYNSVLEMRLSANKIPEEVYHSLVKNVNNALPSFHRYLNLRKKLLGVDQLEFWDIYAPITKGFDLKYTYDEAKELVLEAVTPLGEEYKTVMKRAFDERWIDVMPNDGKRSGAYSNGSAYDIHPYILLNFNGKFDDASTLIHELGHTMHSYLSNKHQHYAKSHYPIFVAEVASTLNEALLEDMMLKKLTDKKAKLALLLNILDGYKGTLFRQTQFAEFELALYTMIEKGEPITGKKLSDTYLEIARRYYGHDKGICNIDEKLALEWAFIHHFYYGYYVYQYSTSFVASRALSTAIIEGNQDAIAKYLKFLSSGCSKYPIDLLKEAGVDMMSDEPFNACVKRMNQLMDMVEELL